MKKNHFPANRIEIYYAVSILVIIALLLGFFYLVGRDYIVEERTENLRETTERTQRDVDIAGGNLEVDQDVSYSNDGAFVVLADSQGKIIDGALGSAFTDTEPYEDGKLRMVEEGGERYYIYDKAIRDGDTCYWLRGVTSAEFSEMAPAVTGTLRTATVLLPALILIVLLAGWLVTWRALAPLREITRTAELIQREGDLSRRIGIQARGNRDEIRHTAEVFDSMLDKIEKNFEREKRFTDDAGHELRTPVAVVMAECEYALDNLEDPAELENSLNSILAESRHMSELISLLLLFARADRGMLELHRERVDLSLLAEECCDRAGKAAEEKDIRLSVDATEGIYANCDSTLMGRALDNLIGNGIKYGREQGFVRVKVEAAGNREARIIVEDDGIGIPPEEMENIWDRFYRAENAMAYTDVSGEDESMGLGLALVQWICTVHGGTVSCESQVGQGTRFTMRIPLMSV